MVMTEHTIKAFDADLQELGRMIAEMGGLAERLIGDSVDALSRQDTMLAQNSRWMQTEMLRGSSIM